MADKKSPKETATIFEKMTKALVKGKPKSKKKPKAKRDKNNGS